MWTRLFYLSAKTAFKTHLADGRLVHRALPNRYQNMLKKQFRIHNVPWTFTKLPDDAMNPRHKRPKGSKVDLSKQRVKRRDERAKKVYSYLKTADEQILKHRQEKLNKRKLTGYFLSQDSTTW